MHAKQSDVVNCQQTKLTNRKILALKYKFAFSKVINSIQFKDFIMKYGLNMYKFEIISKTDRNEAIDLCCLKLARSRNIPSNIVNLSPTDCKSRFTTEIDHAIQTQTAFVVRHIQTNKIAFIYIDFDIMDLPKYNVRDYPIAYRKRCELLEVEYMELEKVKKQKGVRYGEILYGAYTCGNSIFKEENLSLLTTTSFMLDLLIVCGIDSITQHLVGTHCSSVESSNSPNYRSAINNFS